MSDFQVNWGIIPLLFSASVTAPSIVDNNKPLPTLKALQERYLGNKPVPIIPARQQDLASYDHLLQGNWYLTEAVGHA